MNGADEVMAFRATVERNRQIFSLEHPYAYFAFFGLLESLDRVGRRLQEGRDANKKTHVSLIPFLLIVQRQFMNAFDALSTCRSYEAWVSLRPAIESALTMGKWVENPDNAAIWSSRDSRKTEYIKNYSGRGLVSASLPRASEIRAVLDRLNDEFLHANDNYYSRHTSLEPAADGGSFLRLDFFDAASDVGAHALAFLHLLAVVSDALDQMCAVLLPATGAHAPILPALEAELGERAAKVRLLHEAHDATLVQLGIWPNAV